MSLMQTFRDGYRLKLHVDIGRLTSHLATFGCMVMTAKYGWNDQYQPATFWAVLALWGITSTKGKV